MNAQPVSRRGLRFILFLLGLFFLILLAVAVTAAASPSVTSMLRGAGLPTATPEIHFMLAEIAKPTYTPLPTATPLETATPLPTPTATPPLLEMSIVEESSLPSGGNESAPSSYAGSKYILVDISEQHMYVYENDQLIYSFVASTGINNSTRAGLFHVQSKYPNAYGATWNIWMPSWLGIYYAGGLENGIHALPILPGGGELWAGYLGRPVSYGCVVLGSYEASVLYNWAEIGTPVEIRW
ncbi:MAG: murein L,D-transpeptidase [Anaerolineaceae bacterium]|nr:MAG: murein L,D-transpeptidase [Anaerolineaceae bacterium]